MNVGRRFQWGAFVVGLLAITSVSAKTLYVDVFGDDQGGANTSCKKTLPCLTIQHAINQATAGSRVIVGPGSYQETIAISLPRIKLISTAGARGTKILGDGNTPITVDAEKVAIGQKGKGFTITGNIDGGFGIFVTGNSDGSRVEGNIITYDSTDEATIVSQTEEAILLDSIKTTVRYNQIRYFDRGIVANAGAVGARFLIADNVISDIEQSCIEMSPGPGSRSVVKGNHLARCGYYDAGADSRCLFFYTGFNSKSRITDNVIDGCGTDGLYIESANPGDAKTGDKLINNVVMKTYRDGTFGEAVVAIGGNPEIRRSLIKTALFGVSLNFTYGASVKDNLFSQIGDDALYQGDNGGPSFDTTFSGNTVEDVGGLDGVLYIRVSDDPGTTPIKQMTRNNFTNYPADVEGFTLSGAGALNMADHGFKTSKNFWGDLTSLDGLPSLEGAALTAVNDGHVTMSPSLKANPVKYKGGL